MIPENWLFEILVYFTVCWGEGDENAGGFCILFVGVGIFWGVVVEAIIGWFDCAD